MIFKGRQKKKVEIGQRSVHPQIHSKESITVDSDNDTSVCNDETDRRINGIHGSITEHGTIKIQKSNIAEDD